MNIEIQVYDGDGVSPIPYTFEDACKVVFPHMGPFRELDLSSARITRGQENLRYYLLQEVVFRLTDWVKNTVLQNEIRKMVEIKPGIRLSVYGLGGHLVEKICEANKFSDWKEEDRPNTGVAIGSQTLSGLDLPLGSAPTSMAVGDFIMIDGKAREVTKVINGTTFGIKKS